MYKLLPILLFAYGLAVTTEDIYDNSYALIIGIDKYENVSNLDYAVKDANSIASLLKDNFNFPAKNVKVLINDEATYSNIRNNLDEISSSAKENDRVLIYFAGHGMTQDLPEGGEMGYLLPIDGKRDKLFVTSIPMDDLKRISSMSQAKHMLFLVDACYGGLAATGSRGLSSTSPNYIEKITKDKSRQIITAGGRGEEVIEKAEWGHSAFTLNLLRGLEDGKGDLNDDGYITADELGLFLKQKVTIDSDSQQTPQSRRFTSQEGEFIFVTNISKLEINNPQITINESNQIDYNILAKEVAEEIKKGKNIYKLKVTLFSNLQFNLDKIKTVNTKENNGVDGASLYSGMLFKYFEYEFEPFIEFGNIPNATSFGSLLSMTFKEKLKFGFGGTLIQYQTGSEYINKYMGHSDSSLDGLIVFGLGSKTGIYAELQAKGNFRSFEPDESFATSEQFKIKVSIKEKINLVYYDSNFRLGTKTGSSGDNYYFIVGADGTDPHIGLTTEMDAILDSKGCWSSYGGETASSNCTYLYQSDILTAGNFYFQMSHIFSFRESFVLELGVTYTSGWGYHFDEYLEASGSSTVSRLKSARDVNIMGLFLGINYHI